MSSSKPKPERPPTPSKPTLIDTNPFYIDMSRGTHRKALRPFTTTLTTTLTPLLRPRTSSEILADLQPEQNNPPAEHIPSRPSTPTPSRRPRTPPKSPARTSPRSSTSTDDPSQDVFQTPERNHSTPVMRIFIDTSPAASSGTSKRSADVDGDIRMKNTTPETHHLSLRALVTQIVHETFSLERARLADEIRRQVLASLEQHIGQLVRDNFEAALAEALEEPFEVGEREGERAREAAVVRVVRERLAGLSCDGLVEVFCNEEVLGVLRRVVGVVEGEVCGLGWDLVAL
ncbi:hypothetical protein BDP81DRAFT_418931 [Colletotrichum phormii]|uniref:Uncharacterized protein n=1 Tax=Colletotrichum phormii TaxID=359342 RepID=A0AAJ0EIC9_9PEZI|nr:uncharacterized protein BDP81DRAFT_418931 [Colletotrichum phormii]KAK1641452.1 hypothetical protein BDP81DRAFT_418931 [Colletotrichum phormii]